jgi:hypothetical protein
VFGKFAALTPDSAGGGRNGRIRRLRSYAPAAPRQAFAGDISPTPPRGLCGWDALGRVGNLSITKYSARSFNVEATVAVRRCVARPFRLVRRRRNGRLRRASEGGRSERAPHTTGQQNGHCDVRLLFRAKRLLITASAQCAHRTRRYPFGHSPSGNRQNKSACEPHLLFSVKDLPMRALAVPMPAASSQATR